MTTVRTVFGMPAYNRPDTLSRTLESLLSQTRTDFAIVIVDDKPGPEVQAIVERFAKVDSRIVYEPNPVRLGMVGNWRKAFDRGRELFPGSQYFAWVSDHDIWHPEWLETLAGELDADPKLVLAYPYMQRVYTTHRRSVTREFDTSGIGNPLDRLRQSAGGMTAGNCIYALFRSDALAQAGVFRPVLAPDRQILLQLMMLGEFKHVPEILWYREVAGMFSYGRQRTMFFPTHVPWHTYLPVPVQHFGVVFWDFAIRGAGRPSIGRIRGLVYACAQFFYTSRREVLRDDASWRKAIAGTPLGRWLARRPSARDADESEAAETGA